MTVQCGNENHPDGPWHVATPLPSTWEREAVRRYDRNVERWGCGCDRRPLHKLYVIVRGDLAPGLRAAQAGHAVAEAILAFPEPARRWRRTDNYLIILEVPSLGALQWNQRHLRDQSVPFVTFTEPDLNDEPTAIACIPPPEANGHLAHLPLAFAPGRLRALWLRFRASWSR